MRTVGGVEPSHVNLTWRDRGRESTLCPADRLVKGMLEPDKVVRACYPSTGNTEAGRLL